MTTSHSVAKMADTPPQKGAKQRIVFMGSPAFAIPTLDHLVKTHEVCAVYSQPAKKSGRGMKKTPVPVAAYAHSADCLLYTSPSPRDRTRSRMPSSA